MRKFNLSQSVAYRISRMKKEGCDSHFQTSKGLARPKFPQTEVLLVQYIEHMRQHGLSLSGEIIKTAAKVMNEQTEEKGFKGSNGWLSGFLRRTGMKSLALYGEAGSVSLAEAKEAMQSVLERLKEYPLECIYNMVQ